MDLFRVLFLAILQGVTELFPVSSLGHTVIIPGLLGWKETLKSPDFLPLVVTLHLGTAAALLTFFWRDWVDLLRGGAKVLIAGKFSPDVDPQGYGRQLALVVVGTIPPGIIGVLFQKQLESLFSQPILAAAFLCLNGAVLLAAERLTQAQRRKGAVIHGGLEYAPAGGGMTMGATAQAAGKANSGEVGKSFNDMTFVQAAIIGGAQIFALIPGISRSGATMVAGMVNGLSHEAAARFSFLLATPIILAAGLLEVPKLLKSGHQTILYAGIGGVVAGLAAYLSVRFLMRFFQTNRLDPFAYYCVGAGLLSFAYFLLKFLHILP